MPVEAPSRPIGPYPPLDRPAPTRPWEPTPIQTPVREPPIVPLPSPPRREERPEP
jgi:hypothetical protein